MEYYELSKNLIQILDLLPAGNNTIQYGEQDKNPALRIVLFQTILHFIKIPVCLKFLIDLAAFFLIAVIP